MSYSISIDGPSGAGKSTISKKIAEELGIEYIDTGAMYRAVALFFIQNDIDADNPDSVEKALNRISLDFCNGHICLNGKDVSNLIRDERISSYSSKISQIQEIRDKLVMLQRDISKNKSVIMEGRDIGSVVLPDADYKFYLEASPERRAQRRYIQLREMGKESELEAVKFEIEKRDYDDMNRENSPLIVPEDAIKIDSTDITIDETVKLIIDIVGTEDVL